MARPLNRPTMSKINRENRQRQHKADKLARKALRRAQADAPASPDPASVSSEVPAAEPRAGR